MSLNNNVHKAHMLLHVFWLYTALQSQGWGDQGMFCFVIHSGKKKKNLMISLTKEVYGAV